MPPDTSLYAERPALSVNGEADIKLSSDLLYLEIDHNLSQPARCELHLENIRELDGEPVFKYFDLNTVDFGDDLTVACGSADSESVIFKGQVNRIESRISKDKRPVMVVHAEDALHKLRYRNRTQVYEEVRDSDIIQQLLEHYGLTSNLPQFDTVHKTVTQLNQDDLGFIQQRLLRNGAYILADGENVTVGMLVQPDPAENSLMAGSFQQLNFSADLRYQDTVFGVAGWDVQAKQGIARTASFNDLPPGSGSSGGQVLTQAFFDSHDVEVSSVPDSSSDADTLARALHDTKAMRFVTGYGVLSGCAAHHPGDKVKGKIAEVRGLEEGQSAISPARFPVQPPI